MLEVKVLKDMHSTVAEAKKVLPYIKECDILSIELSNTLREDAELYEAAWRTVIRSDMSRMKYQEKMVPIIRQVFCRNPVEFVNNVLKVHEYVFLERKPLWLIEKYSLKEQKECTDLVRTAGELQQLCMSNLLRGDLSELFKCTISCYRAINEYSNKRDSIIARELQDAEQRIREHYSLAVDPLKLAILIGAGHAVEKNESLKEISVKAIHLAPPNPELEIIDYVRENSASIQLPDKIKKATLCVMINHAMGNGARQASEKLTNMTLNELYVMAQSLSKPTL